MRALIIQRATIYKNHLHLRWFFLLYARHWLTQIEIDIWFAFAPSGKLELENLPLINPKEYRFGAALFLLLDHECR